ncbi:MAG: S1 RNA-binding domain-containing protein [Patescibacteria group bacterium]|jgi:small subunit ribosomal protein S1
MSEDTENVAATEAVAVKEKGKDSMASLMEELGDNLLPFVEGDTVEAVVLAIGGTRVWVDVSGQSLGFIPEREVTGTKSSMKIGEKILCTVVSIENEEGHVVLSMKQADREKYWQEMEDKFKSGEPFMARITDANKGGLTVDVGGILGFLPVSQLAPANYPRVSGGDKDEILNRLRKFIGQEILVKVINCDKEGNKLIFSERAVKATEIKEKVNKYKVGDKVKGKITGIVDFGLFVNIDQQIEGLIHISEISWSRVSDLSKLFKVGDDAEAMVISIDDGRISLSLKRLLPDPWVRAAAKYKASDIVEGEITKITPFGAFVSLDEEIDGLVHVSELSDKHVVDPSQIVELGKRYSFKIISIEPENHRLGLSLKAVNSEPKEEKVDVEEAKTEEAPVKATKAKKSKAKEEEVSAEKA